MKRDDEIARELQAHLELEAEEYREAGLSAEEARYAALRSMGSAAQIHEETRAVWRSVMLEQMVRDLKYAFRMLWRSPGFTLVAVLCLGLGIGASTTIFSVVNAVLFKPLPYKDSGRLVRVYTEFPTFPGGGLPKFALSPVEFRELQEQGRAWDQIEGWVNGGANLAGAASRFVSQARSSAAACSRWSALLRFMGARSALRTIGKVRHSPSCCRTACGSDHLAATKR